MKGEMKTNNKSMSIYKKAVNASMQVSSEGEQLSESKSFSCKKEALKSAVAIQNRSLIFFNCAMIPKSQCWRKTRKNLRTTTHKWQEGRQYIVQCYYQ